MIYKDKLQKAIEFHESCLSVEISSFPDLCLKTILSLLESTFGMILTPSQPIYDLFLHSGDKSRFEQMPKSEAENYKATLSEIIDTGIRSGKTEIYNSPLPGSSKDSNIPGRIICHPLTAGSPERNSILVIGGKSTDYEDEDVLVLRLAINPAWETYRRRLAELEQIKSSEEYAEVIDNIGDLVCEVDGNGVITYANGAYKEILGYSKEEVVGHKSLDFIHPAEVDDAIERFAQLLETDRISNDIWRFRTKNGEMRSFNCRGRLIQKDDGSTAVVVISRDITNELRHRDDALAKEAQCSLLFQAAPFFMALINNNREVLRINRHGEQSLLSPAEGLEGYRIGHIMKCLNSLNDPQGCGTKKECGNCGIRQTIAEVSDELFQTKKGRFPMNTSINGKEEIRLLDITATCIDVTDPRQILLTINDVTESVRNLEENRLNNERLESLLMLSHLKTKDHKELLDITLQEAITLTRSKIGYIYYYSEEKKEFILNSWSNGVMDECSIVNPQTTYTLNATGCWGEAVRQRKPIIINDYENDNPWKKGTPDGHVDLKRFLTIPVFEDYEIVAVVGVANKESEYDQSDVRQLQLLMDNVWKLIKRQQYDLALIKAKQKAEESDKLKTAFLENMSHEIRTPMNGILGFTELLSLPDISEESRQEYIGIIEESSQSLLNIVNDILDISKIETGQLKLSPEIWIIEEELKDLVQFLTPLAKRKGLELQLLINEGNTKVYSDRQKIKQILQNLINNAIKFTNEGIVQLAFEKTVNSLIFKVIDSGIGIETSMQESIFERFRQVQTEETREYGGTGLGLSISRSFAQLMHGTLNVKSEKGSGSTFTLTLPINPEGKTADKEKITDIQLNKENLKILAAEDEMMNFHLLNTILSKQGIKVDHAKNGQEAVQKVETGGPYDLVIMDIKMPVMNGIEALKEIKRTKPDLPVLALTAYAFKTDVERGQMAGFDGYLTKPVKSKKLLKTVYSLLST